MTRGWGNGVGVAWIGVGVVVAAFFLPWASISVKPGSLGNADNGALLSDLVGRVNDRVGRVEVTIQHGRETLRGSVSDLATMPTRITGADIPQLARRQETQIALALAELATGQRDLSQKTARVYLVPSVAVLCGLLVLVGSGLPAACMLVGVGALAIAGVGFWKLTASHPHATLVTVALGPGLWWSCWGYAVLGLGALLTAVVRRGRGVAA